MTDHPEAAAGDVDLSVLPAALRQWVQTTATSGMTGTQARSWLLSQGWPLWVGDTASAAIGHLAARDGRAPVAPPPRMNPSHQHTLAYGVLFVTVGVAALALGSTVHLLLAWAVESRQGSEAIANWVTLFACTLPFAVVAHHKVTKIEVDDPLAMFSPVRESLSLILLWAAGVVGGVRLVAFVHQLVTALVVERELSNLGRDLAHVVTVVAIAGWVFAWTWSMRERVGQQEG